MNLRRKSVQFGFVFVREVMLFAAVEFENISHSIHVKCFQKLFSTIHLFISGRTLSESWIYHLWAEICGNMRSAIHYKLIVESSDYSRICYKFVFLSFNFDEISVRRIRLRNSNSWGSLRSLWQFHPLMINFKKCSQIYLELFDNR